MNGHIVRAAAQLFETTASVARRYPAAWLTLFGIGGLVGLTLMEHAHTWTRGDVLPPVLGMGISLPIGWLAGRRRDR